MSIETEINRISTNVSDTLSAISEMGGEVPDGATSDDMASGVRSIPVGAKIDDTTPSSTTTYSSQKIEAEISTLNEAKANKEDLAKVAESGSYNDLSDKPTIPTVPSSLPNPNKLILSGAVTAEYDGSAPVSVEIPEGGSGGQSAAYELVASITGDNTSNYMQTAAVWVPGLYAIHVTRGAISDTTSSAFNVKIGGTDNYTGLIIVSSDNYAANPSFGNARIDCLFSIYEISGKKYLMLYAPGYYCMVAVAAVGFNYAQAITSNTLQVYMAGVKIPDVLKVEVYRIV